MEGGPNRPAAKPCKTFRIFRIQSLLLAIVISLSYLLLYYQVLVPGFKSRKEAFNLIFALYYEIWQVFFFYTDANKCMNN